jgi:hypothetical protein
MPKLRLPAASDRWTWLLILAYVQLRLAPDAVIGLLLPWQLSPLYQVAAYLSYRSYRQF